MLGEDQIISISVILFLVVYAIICFASAWHRGNQDSRLLAEEDTV